MTIEAPTPIEETVLRFNGKAKRTTLERSSYAECLDPDCDSAWVGSSSVVASGNHALGTGHSVFQHYEASYKIEPNLPDKAQPHPVRHDDQIRAGKRALHKARSKVTSKKPIEGTV
jgi:hypothetical protein